MYRLHYPGGKRDLAKQWALPDRVLFACGACHVLAHAFLEEYPDSGFAPIWIRPAEGFTGNHIVVVREEIAFDYHGYSSWPALVAHTRRRADQYWPGWCATLTEIPPEILISESKSKEYGLRLKEPVQFLFDAMPRAQAYLRHLPAPPPRGPVAAAR